MPHRRGTHFVKRTRLRPNRISGLQCWTMGDQSVNPDNAANFTAANSERLSVASNADLQGGSTALTIYGWARTSTPNTFQYIVSKWSGAVGTSEYRIYFESNRMRINVSDGTSQSANVTPFVPIIANLWYFFVFWHDPTLDTINLFVNNDTVNTGTLSWTTNINANTQAFTLGSRTGGTGHLNGDITGVRVVRRVLDASEQTSLYQRAPAHAALTAGDLTNMVASYDLKEFSDGATGAVTRVDSVNGYNLTDTNTCPSNFGSPVASNSLTDGDPVNRWLCQTTSTSIIQQTTANQPLYKVNEIGSRSALRFDGTDDFMTLNGLASTFTGVGTAFTFFVVFKKSGNTGAQQAIHFGNSADADPFLEIGTNDTNFRMGRTDNAGTTQLITGGTVGTTQPHLATLVCDGTTIWAYGDGALLGTDSTSLGTLTLDRGTLGAKISTTTSEYFNGSIGEVLLYNRALSDLERRDCERFLAEKFTISISEA